MKLILIFLTIFMTFGHAARADTSVYSCQFRENYALACLQGGVLCWEFQKLIRLGDANGKLITAKVYGENVSGGRASFKRLEILAGDEIRQTYSGPVSSGASADAPFLPVDWWSNVSAMRDERRQSLLYLGFVRNWTLDALGRPQLRASGQCSPDRMPEDGGYNCGTPDLTVDGSHNAYEASPGVYRSFTETYEDRTVSVGHFSVLCVRH